MQPGRENTHIHTFFSFKIVVVVLVNFWVQQFLLLLSYFLSLRVFTRVYDILRTFTHCAPDVPAALSPKNVPCSLPFPSLHTCRSHPFQSTLPASLHS